MTLINRYRLEFTTFISGAIVMIVELVGARIFAPYYGTSINTWTVLIGVILGSLSIGYWYGGRLADKHASTEVLAKILFFAGINLIAIALSKDFVIYYVTKLTHFSFILENMFVAILLFLSPNILLGMVSPYIVKLKLKSLQQSGANIGALYAISTMGSIFGTFGAGFILIPLLGVSKIMILMGILLLMSSLFISSSRLFFLKIFIIICSLIILYGLVCYESFAKKNGLVDIDSPSGRIFIFNTTHPITHEPSTYLITGAFGYQSSKSGTSISPYVLSSDLIIKSLIADKRKMLVIGGGAFSLPDYFLNTYQSLYVDVVEIDKEIVKLAAQYFNHKENDRLKTYITDGRIFINSAKSKYNVIFNDAYTDLYPPYNISTKEALEKIHKLLYEDGLYISNVISPLEGKDSRLFQSIYKTYSSVFSQVLVFPLQNGVKKEEIQNILLVGIKSHNVSPHVSLPKQWIGNIDVKVPIFTDDYVPIENDLLSITTKKPLYPMSRYFLEASIHTSKKFAVTLLKSVQSILTRLFFLV